MKNKGQTFTQLVVIVVGFGIMIIGGLMFGIPQYKVWQQGLEGEAELSKANYSKKVAVQEAQAKMDSAKLLAQAEIERARGVAEANKIIGDSLHGNEDYLRYLWIVDVANQGTDKTVIYVPTETNLPILEAARGL